EGDQLTRKPVSRASQARNVQIETQQQNELACRLLQQGRLPEAAAHFARAMALMPELLEEYAPVVATLLNINPSLREGVARVAKACHASLPPRSCWDRKESPRSQAIRCSNGCLRPRRFAISIWSVISRRCEG